MASPAAQNLIDQITAADTLEKSVQAWIDGEAARVQAAVDAAIAGGVSASDLAGVQAALDQLKADAPVIPQALVTNTKFAKVK